MQFFTIGVYNSSEKEFFDKLIKNNIDTFCDIRQRRAVRGAKYAFANSHRLQKKLSELNIRYEHILELAPSTEIRNLQKKADAADEVLSRERQQLAQPFITEYKNKILNQFDFDNFLLRLRQSGAKRIIFFCVEEHAEACHRSIVSKKLNEKYGYTVTNL